MLGHWSALLPVHALVLIGFSSRLEQSLRVVTGKAAYCSVLGVGKEKSPNPLLSELIFQGVRASWCYPGIMHSQGWCCEDGVCGNGIAVVAES